jgi:hypothetical protein
MRRITLTLTIVRPNSVEAKFQLWIISREFNREEGEPVSVLERISSAIPPEAAGLGAITGGGIFVGRGVSIVTGSVRQDGSINAKKNKAKRKLPEGNRASKTLCQ